MANTTNTPGPTPESTYYKRPGWFMRKTLTPFLNLLMRLGISAWGSRVLEHRGRRSGTLHHTPVNLLTLGEKDYLVAARGETEWVRNVRAADGNLTLILGRQRQDRTATEVPVDARAADPARLPPAVEVRSWHVLRRGRARLDRRRVRSHRRATPGVHPALDRPSHHLARR